LNLIPLTTFVLNNLFFTYNIAPSPSKMVEWLRAARAAIVASSENLAARFGLYPSVLCPL